MNFKHAPRGQFVVAATVLALLIALAMTLAPSQNTAKAKGSKMNQMVSNTGQMQDAPEMGLAAAAAFNGSGSFAGITGTDSADDGTTTPLLPRLLPGSVIGADGRTQVTATTTYPYRANAWLKVNFPGASGTCTGWFIGPRTVMTAGHCVYDTDLNKWATSITVYPGRNGSKSPYGSVNGCYFWSVTGWTSSENTEYDYGAIILPSNKPLGNTVGWYGFFWTSNDASLDEDAVRIYGYPGDKPSGTQWGMKGRIKEVTTRKLFHNVDTAGGQSGSAVYETRTNGPYADSIHTNGVYGGSPYNRSTRITQGVFNNMLNWKNNPSCP